MTGMGRPRPGETPSSLPSEAAVLWLMRRRSGLDEGIPQPEHHAAQVHRRERVSPREYPTLSPLNKLTEGTVSPARPSGQTRPSTASSALSAQSQPSRPAASSAPSLLSRQCVLADRDARRVRAGLMSGWTT